MLSIDSAFVSAITELPDISTLKLHKSLSNGSQKRIFWVKRWRLETLKWIFVKGADNTAWRLNHAIIFEENYIPNIHVIIDNGEIDSSLNSNCFMVDYILEECSKSVLFLLKYIDNKTKILNSKFESSRACTKKRLNQIRKKKLDTTLSIRCSTSF